MNPIYIVRTDYDNKGDSFTVWVGVKNLPDIIEGISVKNFPSSNHKHYVTSGTSNDEECCVTNKWKEIEKSSLNREYTYDFDVYGGKSKDPMHTQVDIYVSVSE